MLITIILITIIVLITKLNKDSYIENERRCNKEQYDKVVNNMLNIYKQGKEN